MDTFVDMFDQKEERKMGERGGGGRERENGKGEREKRAKERKIVRCRFKVIAREFLRKFHVSGQGTFSIYPAQIE